MSNKNKLGIPAKVTEVAVKETSKKATTVFKVAANTPILITGFSKKNLEAPIYGYPLISGMTNFAMPMNFSQDELVCSDVNHFMKYAGNWEVGSVALLEKEVVIEEEHNSNAEANAYALQFPYFKMTVNEVEEKVEEEKSK